MIATRKRLITAEQYMRMPDDGRHTELVRGRIEVMPMPKPRHGWYCVRVIVILEEYARKHKSGRVFSNDSGVVTERDPDTVRGADVAYYSYKRVPRGKLPPGYLAVPPEAIFEVRSPDDRKGRLLTKIGEYLTLGVDVVCLNDPEAATITVYQGDMAPRVLEQGATLDLTKVLPGFRVPVARFFEVD
jgi:Uma2 family endonuclease